MYFLRVTVYPCLRKNSISSLLLRQLKYVFYNNIIYEDITDIFIRLKSHNCRSNVRIYRIILYALADNIAHFYFPGSSAFSRYVFCVSECAALFGIFDNAQIFTAAYPVGIFSAFFDSFLVVIPYFAVKHIRTDSNVIYSKTIEISR